MEGLIRIEAGTTKNGKEGQRFPFRNRCERCLKGIGTTRPPGIAFVCYRQDKQGHARPIGDFRKAWAKALEQAGLASGILFHDLRRSAVRNFIRAGVGQRVAQSISGHLSGSIFDRYNITSAADITEAGRKLENFLGENSYKAVTNRTTTQQGDIAVN